MFEKVRTIILQLSYHSVIEKNA